MPAMCCDLLRRPIETTTLCSHSELLIPLLYFLWTRLDQIPADEFFGIWIRVLMTLNAVSLIIDAVDVGRYIAGERAETVKGL